MVKCIILNGIPAVIEAALSISEVEKPEDQDHSCSRYVAHVLIFSLYGKSLTLYLLRLYILLLSS